MLIAVGSLCPFLKKVFFCREPYTGEDSASNPPLGQLDTSVSPEELKSILRDWPKVISLDSYFKIALKYYCEL